MCLPIASYRALTVAKITTWSNHCQFGTSWAVKLNTVRFIRGTHCQDAWNVCGKGDIPEVIITSICSITRCEDDDTTLSVSTLCQCPVNCIYDPRY